MSAILKHTVAPAEFGGEDGGHEIYHLKFKDSGDKAGVRIHRGGESINIKEIILEKIPKVNNGFVMKIVHFKEQTDKIILK